MNIDPTLQPLIEALIAYQEDQETLTPLVEKAQDVLGPEWTSFIQTSLDTMTGVDEPTKEILKKKADHAIHYYGALAAWEEAYQYINDPQSVNNMQLIERIPTLEYWLALFGDEGTKVINQLKNLLNNVAQNDITEPVEHVSEFSEEQKTHQISQTAEVIETEEKTEVSSLNAETNSVLQEKIETEIDTSSLNEQPSIPEERKEDKEQSKAEEKIIEQFSPNSSIETMPKIPEIAQPTTELESSEEIHLNEMPALPEVSIDQQAIEEISETPNNLSQQVTSEELSENILSEEANPTSEVLEMLAPQQIPETPEIPEDDPNLQIPKTKNWEIANFMRQKNLYEEATNWISAHCVRLNNMDKTEYPYYGFVVDLMNELKENIQNLLENQLLEEVIDTEVPGGREGMENLLEALEKELEDLPENLKPAQEQNEVDPRKILGEMDTSQEKEYIGPAPDGFELMEDPYEVSPEKIIEDYKKTEEEAQVNLDSLNVTSSSNNEPKKE